MTRFFAILVSLSCFYIGLHAKSERPDSLTINKVNDNLIVVAFGEMEERRIVNAVEQINPSEVTQSFNSMSWKDVLSIGGLSSFGSSDIRGGKYVVIVDGHLRDGSSSAMSFIDKISTAEIESITILSDAASRILYGSLADQGIILITTKHGQAGKSKLNVQYEADFCIPISYPGYVKSADYMALYNKALSNDGMSQKYSYDDIENARAKTNPLLYPENDYYNSTFLRSFKPQHNLEASFSGGNKAAQFFLDLNWYNTSSIIKLGQAGKQHTNRFNVRGNVDISIGNYIKVILGAVAAFNTYQGANYSNKNFWQLSSSERVNARPFLIPIDAINSEYQDLIDDAQSQHSIIDGKFLLGGDQTFPQNIYGDLLLGGYSKSLDRMAEVNVCLDVDLNFITKGLRFRTDFANNNYNRNTVTQANSYAVYSPTPLDDGSYAISRIGVNDFVGTQAISDVAFFRRIGWNSLISYKRSFNNMHDLNITANSILSNYKESGSLYSEKMLSFGLRANYLLAQNFIFEYNGAAIGSARFGKNNKWGYASSLGFGLVKDYGNSDLKISATYAYSKTDIDTSLKEYHLYQNTYVKNGTYSYGDGSGSNGIMDITSGSYNLGWIRKHSVNLGVVSHLLDKRILIESNVYYTYRFDEPVRKTNSLPLYFGGEQWLPLENFGSHHTMGAELRVGYAKTWGEWSLSVTGNIKWHMPIVGRYDELDYGLDYYKRSGSSTDAIWGLVADGLYTPDDIANLSVKNSYGEGNVGDIKYRDLNNDGLIDTFDIKEIGNTHARINYGINFSISWKRLSFWAYFFAQTGAEKLFNGDYYIPSGEKKFSVPMLDKSFPRLTTLNNTVNTQKSTYWLRSTNYFSIPFMQLSYTLPGDKFKVYLRADDTIIVGPNAKMLRLNIGSEPQYRIFSIGMTFNL